MIIATFTGAGTSTNTKPGPQVDSDVVEVKKDQGDTMGYVYLGSHNFTPSAWGRLSGSAFTPVLNVGVCCIVKFPTYALWIR
jgi:tyrosyl-DNA phosphodiesterase 1